MKDLIESIKRHEGFRGYPYKDTKGLLTVGYGTLLPLTEYESELILQHRLNKKIHRLNKQLPWLKNKLKNVQDVVYEMAYQLGIDGVLGFKKTLYYIEIGDYKNASKEMLNSLWYKQTPKRALKLSEKIRGATN